MNQIKMNIMKKVHWQSMKVLFQKKTELINMTVWNKPRPQRSSEARNRQEHQLNFEEKYHKTKFISISKQKKRECADVCYRTTTHVMFTNISVTQGI